MALYESNVCVHIIVFDLLEVKNNHAHVKKPIILNKVVFRMYSSAMMMV